MLPRLALDTRQSIETTLGHFERIASPGKVRSIDTAVIDAFIASAVD